jgi:hypothetical protein
MLLCRACQRSKSWSCEHCPNWVPALTEVCSTCSWASPDKYDHVATIKRRQIVLSFVGPDEITTFEHILRDAAAEALTAAAYIKRLLKEQG